MRFHIFGLPHTKTNQDYTACAYTAKVLKFARMMHRRGHTVYHYGHPDSQVECTEHIDVISRETYDRVYGAHDFHSKFFTYNTTDDAYQEFYANAIREVGARRQPHDFLLPFWGAGHRPICDAHPDLITVEPGAGYAGGYWARWKVFESYALFHAYKGLTAVGTCNMDNYEVVIPNYFDPEDFDYAPDQKQDYALFMGRIYDGKGVNIAIDATRRAGLRLKIAGQNGAEYLEHLGGRWPDHCEFVGYADREQRRQLMAQARVAIVASQYLEPFGGVMIESLFSGTPVVTTDWGAATENIPHGVVGYRCRTMEQYVWALRNIHKIDPAVCRSYALNNFALEAIAAKYEEFFQSILAVHAGAGWYADHNINQIHLPQRHLPAVAEHIDFDRIDSEELPQAQRLADYIAEHLRPRTVLDIGCGPGIYTEELIQRGIVTHGLDPDPRTRHNYYSLLTPAERTAQVVICLEVLEHIDPADTRKAIQHLADHIEPNGLLVFTAAQPGQGGTGHINTRTRAEWAKLLTEAGLTRTTKQEQLLKDYMQQGAHMGWFTQNLLVFER